ncbi:MAG: ribosome maturation factor RimP, partial [Bacilli bacterium]|nr:ribosome maturation factor RimP [Bacilli bacterium]
GSEKPLRLEKLAKYVGEFINVHLVNPYEGYNFLEGDLKEVTEEEIKLEIRVKGRKKTLSLARPNIDKARLAIKF